MSVVRNAAVLAALAAAALSGSGCGPAACSANPSFKDAPTSCTLRTGTDVAIPVEWCDCGAPMTCDVTIDGYSIFLAPIVDSCDASCQSSCSTDATTVNCSFTAPAAGTYSVTISNGFGAPGAATFTVNPSGGFSCSG